MRRLRSHRQFLDVSARNSHPDQHLVAELPPILAENSAAQRGLPRRQFRAHRQLPSQIDVHSIEPRPIERVRAIAGRGHELEPVEDGPALFIGNGEAFDVEFPANIVYALPGGR